MTLPAGKWAKASAETAPPAEIQALLNFLLADLKVQVRLAVRVEPERDAGDLHAAPAGTNFGFVDDSPLEETGLELPVPITNRRFRRTTVRAGALERAAWGDGEFEFPLLQQSVCKVLVPETLRSGAECRPLLGCGRERRIQGLDELGQIRLPQLGVEMAEMPVGVGPGRDQNITAMLDPLHRTLDGA